jgi:hypothetical protein
MSIFDSIDLKHGELPGWLNNLVALARPAALTMTTAIPAAGAFTVGLLAFWWPIEADRMAAVSVKFLTGIPDAAWGAITAIALGYTAAKSAEVIRKPAPPAGAPSPEGERAPEPAVPSESIPEAARRLDIPPVNFGPGRPTETME